MATKSKSTAKRKRARPPSESLQKSLTVHEKHAQQLFERAAGEVQRRQGQSAGFSEDRRRAGVGVGGFRSGWFRVAITAHRRPALYVLGNAVNPSLEAPAKTSLFLTVPKTYKAGRRCSGARMARFGVHFQGELPFFMGPGQSH